ncbi:MAG: LysM peptidoglycan-binding domain-containing protein [bacterium]|nr:LysM peptidoglycan-binding domain-containing protein [bacterium]
MKKYLTIIFIILGISSYSYCDYEFEYTIKEGDTLWDIAINELHINPLDFSSFAEEVRQANPWIKDDNVIYSNRKLKLTKEVDIKYAASDNIKTDAIIDAPETVEIKSVSYVVKRGDSLWSILSNKYNLVSPIKLKNIINLCLKMNPLIKNPDVLWVGTKILLPENTQFAKIDDVIPSDTIESEPLQNILNEAENKSPSEVDKLFMKVEDYQLVKNTLVVICFGRYELKIKADRLLIPQNETNANKQEYLINYISSSSKRTSKHLKNLLKEKSYNLIEIIVK